MKLSLTTLRWPRTWSIYVQAKSLVEQLLTVVMAVICKYIAVMAKKKPWMTTAGFEAWRSKGETNLVAMGWSHLNFNLKGIVLRRKFLGYWIINMVRRFGRLPSLDVSVDYFLVLLTASHGIQPWIWMTATILFGSHATYNVYGNVWFPIFDSTSLLAILNQGPCWPPTHSFLLLEHSCLYLKLYFVDLYKIHPWRFPPKLTRRTIKILWSKFSRIVTGCISKLCPLQNWWLTRHVLLESSRLGMTKSLPLVKVRRC